MKELQLIQALDENEKKSLHYFLKCLGTHSNSENKLLKLYEPLAKLKKLPEKSYFLKKLGINNSTTLNVLTFRLKQKIFDLLILDNNLEKHKQHDILNYSAIKLRKKFIQLNFLIRYKGTLKILESELNSLINQCIKYEIYSLAIEVLELKKQIYIRKKGLKEYDKINNKITDLKIKENNIKNAIDFHIYFVAQSDIKFNNYPTELKSMLEHKIIELNDAYHKNHSAFLKYYINIFENYYFTLNENYQAAREVCLDNLKLIQKSPSLYNKQKIGASYIDLFTIDININEYKRALNNIKAALKYFPKYSLNYYKTIETKMMLHCYMHKYQSAINELKVLSKLTTQNYALQYEKLKFYQAYILFYRKEYNKAIKLINTEIKLPIDKKGEEIYLRLIQICINIALNKMILAIQQTNNLLRHYNKYYSRKDRNERVHKLILLFKYLSKNDFTDIKLTESLQRILTSLSFDKKTKWEPLSPELFPIDEWIIKYYQIELKSYNEKGAKLIKKLN